MIRKYGIENDMWLYKRPHIYHLLELGVGEQIVVATYSLKTRHLLIKDTINIPQSHILREFVDYAESKRDKNEEDKKEQ